MHAPESPLSEVLQGSDASVAATLVAEHRRFLAWLEKRVGSRPVAEEILQEAFVKAIERGETVRERESAVAWFFRLLRNAVVDHHRRAASRVRFEGDLDPEREPAAPAEETAAVLCGCIAGLAGTLKPEYAAALRRVELEGLSVKDFADEAGITANNAAVRLFRAREALGKRLRSTCRTCAEHGCLDCTCGAAGGHG